MPKATGRSHASQACDACRRRKIRCERPTRATDPCKQCLEQGWACTYDMPFNRRGPAKRSTRLSQITSDVTDVTRESAGVITPPRYPDCSRVQDSDHLLGRRDHDPATAVSTPVHEAVSRSHLGSQRDTTPNILSLCTHTLMELALQDYLDLLYPILPVIHVPSFKKNHELKKYAGDTSILCLFFSLFAMVNSMLPRRFEHYRLVDARFALEFDDRRKLVNHIQKLVLDAQDVEYFDNVTVTKWASAYCRMVSFACLGLMSRAMMIRSEAEAIVVQLDCHCVASYVGLDEIEAQLRKKALWMTITARLHKSVFDRLCGREDDLFRLANNDMSLLIPHDVDDEYITLESVSEQHEDLPSLVAGFNAEKRLLRCIMWTQEETTQATSHNVEMLSDNLTYILDDLNPTLELWQTKGVVTEPSRSSLRSSQYETQGVNLHATHIWARTLLLDRKIAVLASHSTPTAGLRFPITETKEDLCRQMLHLLLTSELSSLEPNGHALVTKIRQVAGSLVDDDLYAQQGRSEHARDRVNAYLQKFAAILAELDHNYAYDLQF